MNNEEWAALQAWKLSEKAEQEKQTKLLTEIRDLLGMIASPIARTEVRRRSGV